MKLTKVQQIHEADFKSKICEQVLHALPLWFGIESAVQDYIQDVRSMNFLAVFDLDNQEPIGFLALNHHNAFTAEIHVMGVLPRFHGKGIGSKLISEAEKLLSQEHFLFMSVKTLSESRPNAEYDQTRKFYLQYGFIPVEEFKTLWGEDNPCLLLIKNIHK